jgi:type I site-specific restriction endonuclease
MTMTANKTAAELAADYIKARDAARPARDALTEAVGEAFDFIRKFHKENKWYSHHDESFGWVDTYFSSNYMIDLNSAYVTEKGITFEDLKSEWYTDDEKVFSFEDLENIEAVMNENYAVWKAERDAEAVASVENEKATLRARLEEISRQLEEYDK